jgi:hypothetical protein
VLSCLSGGADRGDALPASDSQRACRPSCTKWSACVSCPDRHIECVHPPFVLSLVAKVGGGRGHRVVHGGEVGEVKTGLIWLGGERSRPTFSWVVASWATLSNS